MSAKRIHRIAHLGTGTIGASGAPPRVNSVNRGPLDAPAGKRPLFAQGNLTGITHANF